MHFITTAEAGKKWGISPRRVEILASHRRIPGVISAGKCWLIPSDAVKPEDRRKKRRDPGGPEDNESDRYIFPFVICCVHSAEQVRQFSIDERRLYRLCLLCEAGNFSAARALAEALLSSRSPYIKTGALYYLPTICMYLSDYAAAEKYSLLFRAAVHTAKDHNEELNMLLRSFELELTGASGILQEISAADTHSYPHELLPLAASQKFFAGFIHFVSDGTPLDISPYEIICDMIESEGFFYCAMYLHLYLSLYYGIVHIPAKEYLHFRHAVDIGIEHNLFFPVATFMSYYPEVSMTALNEYPSEIRERFRALSALHTKARNEYAAYRGDRTVLAKLAESDYALISYCLRNYSIQTMAELCGLSRSGMNRRLSKLYDKLNVKSKNEMLQIFLNSLLDWGNADSPKEY